MAQRSELVFTVDLCPRCGQQHDDLEFSRMGSPIAFAGVEAGLPVFDLYDLDLWAMCPTKAEPILARTMGEGEVEVR